MRASCCPRSMEARHDASASARRGAREETRHDRVVGAGPPTTNGSASSTCSRCSSSSRSAASSRWRCASSTSRRSAPIMSAMTYNRMFTLHGVIMVWLFMIPSIPSSFGNYLIPDHGGREGRRVPAAESPQLLPLHRRRRACSSRRCSWAASTRAGRSIRRTAPRPPPPCRSRCSGSFIVGFSTILTGLNFIVTVHSMRQKGLTWMRLPLFVWSIYATSIIQVLATPVLGMVLLLVLVDSGFAGASSTPTRGGDPVLYQHLFWFYSHPRGLHHDPPGDGRRERGHFHVLAKEPLFVQGDCLFVVRARVHGAFSRGVITCSSPG